MEEKNKTIDFNEKKFTETIRASTQDFASAFFRTMDEGVPTAATFMADEPKDGEERAAVSAEAQYRDAPAPLAENRRRRGLFSLLSVAVCVCAVFGVLYARGVFPPFGDRSWSPEVDAPTPAVSPAVSAAAWATAGENYRDLYKLILENASSGNFPVYGDRSVGDMRVSALGDGGDASAPPSVPNSASEEPSPPGERATAGSEYADTGASFPTNETEPLISGSGGAAEKNYSTTNEQVSGVHEADVVKTDGDYIYAINSKHLSIVKADGSDLSLASKIAQSTVTDGQVYFEMYVTGDRLIAIRNGYNPAALAAAVAPADAPVPADAPAPDKEGAADCIQYPAGGWFEDTTVDIFDISDRANPIRIHTLSQSGSYNTSRMIDGHLYLITNHYGDMSLADENEPRSFVPLYTRDGEQRTPSPADVILSSPPTDDGQATERSMARSGFTVIGGIDATETGDFVSLKSVYGDTGTAYMSTDAVYLSRAAAPQTSDFAVSWQLTDTVITKLDLSAGKIEPIAQTRVAGTVLNQFALDEWNGVLRVVTTQNTNVFRTLGGEDGNSESANALYTLDENLNLLGSVSNLAPDERLYSCRFMGDICYFVTFRQTDPLFSVDVSDPASPKVLGALKIPGFSEYLHPYSDGRLFGLGRDADAQTGISRGLKLTMFDNSDPADVRERSTMVLDNDFSSAEQNHKAILIDAEKGLIAFPADGRYFVYGYDDEAGFSKRAEISLDSDNRDWMQNDPRGLFIADTFYVIGANRVGAYAMNDAFAPAGGLDVDEGAYSVNRWSSLWGGSGFLIE